MQAFRSLAVVCLQACLSFGISGCTAPTPPQQASPTQIDAELNRMHDQLHITPAQEAKWNALTQELKTTSQRMQQMDAARAQKAPSMTGMDEMTSREQMMQARVDAMQKIRPKAEQMHSSLSPEQKSMWDNVMISRQVGDCRLLCRSGLGGF